MNAQLKDAIRAIESLPEDAQLEAAEGLIAFAQLIHSGEPLLSPRQQQGVREAIVQADQGDFASDEELAKVWRSFDE